MFVSHDVFGTISEPLTNQIGRACPRVVQSSVAAIVGTARYLPDLVICRADALPDGGTTWTVIGLLPPAGIFVVQSTSATPDWNLRSRGELDDQIPADTSAYVRPLQRVASLELLDVTRLNDQFGDREVLLECAWRVDWIDATPPLHIEARDLAADPARSGAVFGVIEGIRRAILGHPVGADHTGETGGV